jgi:hypothetical protein
MAGLPATPTLTIDGREMTADEALALIVGQTEVRERPSNGNEQRKRAMRRMLAADPATIKSVSLAPEPNDPTPEDIRAGCRRIQREWSPRERQKRAGTFGTSAPWEPLVVVAPSTTARLTGVGTFYDQ